MNEPIRLTADPLFVALTRPAMRWGVTYVALLLNGVLTTEIFLLSQNLLTLAIAFPIHGLFLLLCARDARFFDLAFMGLQTRLPAFFRTLRFWRAASYSPLSIDLPNARHHRRSIPQIIV